MKFSELERKIGRQRKKIRWINSINSFKINKNNINIFSDSELSDLNNLVQINDEILEKWYYQKIHTNLVPINKVSLMLKKFKF